MSLGIYQGAQGRIVHEDGKRLRSCCNRVVTLSFLTWTIPLLSPQLFKVWIQSFCIPGHCNGVSFANF